MSRFDPETNERIRRDVNRAMTYTLLRLLALLAYLTVAAIVQLWSLETLGAWALLLFVPLAGIGASIFWWFIDAPDPWEKGR